jgi:hypothetical protein
MARAWSVNDHGEAVGHAQDVNSANNAMYWSNGVPTVIGPGYAFSINKHSQVVGVTAAIGYPWTWTPGGAVVPLPVLPSATFATPFDINDHGDIVGTALTASGYRGFIIRDGGVSALPGLPGFSNSGAMAVNNHGEIAAYAFNDGGGGRAYFISRSGAVTEIVHPPFSDSSVGNINDKGTVVGTLLGLGLENTDFAWDLRNGLQVLWVNGGSSGQGINDRGDIVGSGGALIRRQLILDFDTLIPAGTQWITLFPLAINNKRAIVGGGYRTDTCCRQIPFFMTPIQGQEGSQHYGSSDSAC